MAQEPAIPAIIARYLDGESIAILAADVGVSDVCIRNRMQRFCLTADQSYRHLVEQALAARIASADDSIDLAEDNIAIARSRAKMQFFRMDFERRCPSLYGPKQEISTRKQVVIVVDRSCGDTDRSIGSNTIPDIGQLAEPEVLPAGRDAC